MLAPGSWQHAAPRLARTRCARRALQHLAPGARRTGTSAHIRPTCSVQTAREVSMLTGKASSVVAMKPGGFQICCRPPLHCDTHADASDSHETVAKFARARRYAHAVLVLLVLLSVGAGPARRLAGPLMPCPALPGFCGAVVAGAHPSVPVADLTEAARPHARAAAACAAALEQAARPAGHRAARRAASVMSDFAGLMQEQENSETGAGAACARQGAYAPGGHPLRKRSADAALQGMQMVDRVGQTIDVIKLDQQRMAEQLKQAETLDAAAVEQWLAHLKSITPPPSRWPFTRVSGRLQRAVASSSLM